MCNVWRMYGTKYCITDCSVFTWMSSICLGIAHFSLKNILGFFECTLSKILQEKAIRVEVWRIRHPINARSCVTRKTQSNHSIFKQGSYAIWKARRTWKNQRIWYLTKKSGNFSIISKILEKSRNLRILMLEAVFMPTLKPTFWVSCQI